MAKNEQSEILSKIEGLVQAMKLIQETDKPFGPLVAPK